MPRCYLVKKAATKHPAGPASSGRWPYREPLSPSEAETAPCAPLFGDQAADERPAIVTSAAFGRTSPTAGEWTACHARRHAPPPRDASASRVLTTLGAEGAHCQRVPTTLRTVLRAAHRSRCHKAVERRATGQLNDADSSITKLPLLCSVTRGEDLCMATGTQFVPRELRLLVFLVAGEEAQVCFGGPECRRCACAYKEISYVRDQVSCVLCTSSCFPAPNGSGLSAGLHPGETLVSTGPLANPTRRRVEKGSPRGLLRK
ncbi:hypothetical protein HPB51_023880 [Rhipicephalus microplus]|uniref:Uncharacterized protein n=1 Tax=Rhipicephalus microplus TaxID=6941 RepID=A0A9J6DD06_RHIMP|nr:hypothetical protein HPB51_023880 [Rhipicephalus microplus]